MKDVQKFAELYLALTELPQLDALALQRALDNMTEQQKQALAHVLGLKPVETPEHNS